jgi:hypothetical protein
MMYSNKEIERWYLGLPFDSARGNGNGKKGRARIEKTVPFKAVTEQEVERLYLGLPLKAA